MVPSQTNKSETEPPTSSRSRILLIEDDRQIRAVLQEALEQIGHDVIPCNNGTEGVEIYKRSQIDLVIMDLLLPDKDGFETLNELKKHNHAVNVLAISGGFTQGNVNILTIAQRLGARQTLAKPFDLQRFTNVVEHMLTSPTEPR